MINKKIEIKNGLVALGSMLIIIFLIFPASADTPKGDYSEESTEIVNDVHEENAVSSEMTSKIIEKIANRENIPSGRLEVLKAGKAKFEVTNKELIEVKVVDKESGDIYGISVDTKGNEVNKNTVEQQEEVAYRQIYGKLTKELHEELLSKNNADKTNVGIWLSGGTDVEQNKGEKDSIAKHEAIEAPIIAEIKKKGKIRYASQYAPLIYAELSKKAIEELEARGDVEVIDKEGIAKPEINSSVPTIRANLVWPYGITGYGVKVAVVEDDGIAFANPYIKDGIYYKPLTPNIDFHATAVAGVIESTHSTYKGVAPGVDLLSANSLDYYESSLIAASDWALSKGANILSLSWGIESDGRLHVMDKYYDYVVPRWPYPTIVKSAGNTAGLVTTPGNAWNVITTGAIDDWNTASWFSPNDVMAWYSSYIDPYSQHSDREKPEVAAVGSRITSTSTSYPWIEGEYDGTSFAAPAVAGEAALLMSNNSSLKTWPEAVRAAIFASAVHNVEGSSRLSENDGMGAVVASEAYKVVANNQLKYGTIYSTTSYPINYTFYAPSGKKVRVAIAWNSKSKGPHGRDTLKVDLDLRVKSPSGNYTGYSLSYDNNYEIVEFYSSVSGYYTAEIIKSRWDAGYSSERLGYAYSIT